MEEKHNS